MSKNGYVYLLHFSRPIHPDRPTQHYLGFTESLASRLAAHRAGNGEAANLCRVAKQRGIQVFMVRAWEGDRTEERRLKSHHNAKRLCPWCNAHIRRPAGLVEVTPGIELEIVPELRAAVAALEENRQQMLRYHNARAAFFNAGLKMAHCRQWLDSVREAWQWA